MLLDIWFGLNKASLGVIEVRLIPCIVVEHYIIQFILIFGLYSQILS